MNHGSPEVSPVVVIGSYRFSFTTAIVAMLVAGLAGCTKSPETVANPVNLNAGLIGVWGAEETGRAGLGRDNLVLTGDVAIVSVESGKVFSFNTPNGRVVVTNSPGLNFGSRRDFSITARIKPLRTETPFGVMSIVDKRQVSGISAALGYALHLEDGRLACQLAPRRSWLRFTDLKSPSRLIAAWQGRKALPPMTFARFISSGPDLRDGQFHDVALTLERRSKTGGKLYVDGKVVLTFDPTMQAASLANTAPLLIGGHADSTLRCGFVGEMATVRLYARAITPAEVAALANTNAPGMDSKP